jgi:MHS family proline/betaine transporter-like MFS transporter
MKKNRANYALIAGHVIECFDATIYGFYAVILAPYFFPPDQSQILQSFSAFAAGFILRPLGAIFFGFLGDRFGRRKPLLASMALVGVPTLIIGFLPTYDQIGLWATAILFTCRLAQGFFYGAEFSGVTVYTYENNAKTGRLGRRMGVLVASGGMGAVIATGMGAFLTMDGMPAQAWRIPFIFGGIAAFVIFIFRRYMQETPQFEEAKRSKKISSVPTFALLSYPGEMLTALFISSLNYVPLYLVTVFGNHMFRDFGYSASESLFFNMSTLIFDSFMIVLYGRLADRTGFKRQIIWGCLWMTTMALPSFYLVTQWPSIFTIYAFMLLISTGNTLVVACTMPYISTFFPTHCRYSAVAFSTTLGTALLGGTTPFIAKYLVEITGWRIAPGFLLIALCVSALTGIYWISNRMKRQNEHKPLDFKLAN